VLYRAGTAIAALVGGEVRHSEPVAAEEEWRIKKLLLRTAAPRGLAALTGSEAEPT
jgi:hypothetical protein